MVCSQQLCFMDVKCARARRQTEAAFPEPGANSHNSRGYD
jgi:hypothetical protein